MACGLWIKALTVTNGVLTKHCAQKMSVVSSFPLMLTLCFLEQYAT
jgi:hypothetical protein